MALDFRVDIKNEQVKRLLDVAPDKVRMRLRQLVEGAAIDVQREMRIKAPIAVTGQLRGSVRYAFDPARLRAVVEPVAKYAPGVEYGQPPHMVSVKQGTPLWQWARLKGINPQALQYSIERKGTKPHPFVRPTYDKMKPKVERDIAAGISKLAEELDNGKL